MTWKVCMFCKIKFKNNPVNMFVVSQYNSQHYSLVTNKWNPEPLNFKASNRMKLQSQSSVSQTSQLQRYDNQNPLNNVNVQAV